MRSEIFLSHRSRNCGICSMTKAVLGPDLCSTANLGFGSRGSGTRAVVETGAGVVAPRALGPKALAVLYFWLAWCVHPLYSLKAAAFVHYPATAGCLIFEYGGYAISP